MVNQAQSLSRDAAERLAINALSFIAADSDRLGRFLAVTGIGPGDIRAAAREPLFLAGVLDHLVNGDETLLAFAAEYETLPEDVVRAREILAGRESAPD